MLALPLRDVIIYTMSNPLPHNQEQQDHDVSVKIGEAFREAHRKSQDTNLVMDLLEQYKESRRKIEKPVDGVRFGAYDAYLSTQD